MFLQAGAVRLTIAIVAAGMVIMPIVLAFERRARMSWRRDWSLLATGIAGAIVLTADHSSSYQDALRAVLEHNGRAEAFERHHPDGP